LLIGGLQNKKGIEAFVSLNPFDGLALHEPAEKLQVHGARDIKQRPMWL
jgi:hypothetical protein